MSELAAMTVNERLFACGLLKQWDAAVARADRSALVALLEQVELTHEAQFIADTAIERARG